MKGSATNRELDARCVNAIRFLAVDAIQRANSGHPGLPMGAAPTAYVLWRRFLRHNPKNPRWLNRDRFVLSAGHGSMLAYALLHLTGYESMPMSEIQRFRQWGSRAPGHPENAVTPGIEVTTGPLGQGIANAVGMAIAEAHLAARFNRPDLPLVDHRTFALLGDGCMMEGISHEACSLAGHLKLGKLVALYDDNRITIDGPTSLAFTEDVTRRFEAYGWRVLSVADGDRDLGAIEAALDAATRDDGRPTLIRVRTTIGFGAPKKANTADAHGSPLGAAEIAAARTALGWEHEPFSIPDDVRAHMLDAVAHGEALEREWRGVVAEHGERFPEDAAAFAALVSGKVPDDLAAALPSYGSGDKGAATRSHSGTCLNALAKVVPGLIGGSADLAPSNKTLLKGSTDFSASSREGRNLRFGVREHAMGAICNGIALHGSGLVPYCATFLVFADYMRAAIRVSALSRAGVIYAMTHDSIAVGEDGPTHQPVEHVASLRLIPELVVIRPADGNETSGAYAVAVARRNGPTLLALSRQDVPNLHGTSALSVQKGAYVVSGGEGVPRLVLIGTGAELGLCAAAAEKLRAEGIAVRVVSMPSFELFEAADAAYRESVLPAAVTARLAVEAGSTSGWARWVGDRGAVIGLDRFGASAPGEECLERFGFTVDNVVARAKEIL
ncbi:MAG: transketolase [Proteobacteria bacterium]|jgi:transketolase|nr:transketolase [Pseudomonadota bacterium]